MSEDSEIARLRAELDLSRRELATTRAQLEEALEELAAERNRPAPETSADAPTEARPAVLGRIADRLRRQGP